MLGLGLRELSVAPGEMLEVKNAIPRIAIAGARALAIEAHELGSVVEMEALLETPLGQDGVRRVSSGASAFRRSHTPCRE